MPPRFHLQPPPIAVPLASELPFHPGLAAQTGMPGGLFELLLQRTGGANRRLTGGLLDLVVVASGDGRHSPCLRAVRVYAPRFCYQDEYLPALFHQTAMPDEADQTTPGLAARLPRTAAGQSRRHPDADREPRGGRGIPARSVCHAARHAALARQLSRPHASIPAGREARQRRAIALPVASFASAAPIAACASRSTSPPTAPSRAARWCCWRPIACAAPTRPCSASPWAGAMC